MLLRELFESPRTAVMAFGRMNPPTIGHAKLVDALKNQGGDPYLFLSQSQKPKTDPLDFETKLSYAKFFFPEITIGNPEVKTIMQALQKINELGYDNLIYVAGSDRVASFEELINKYNGQEYNFKSIKVVSAGERDPDADGAEGMSASKLRTLAAQGKLEDWKDEKGETKPGFRSGVPRPEVADEMYAAVRQAMGIKDKEAVPAESIEEGMFGLSSKEKGSIMNVVEKLSDIPGMWDHAAQTFTPEGLEKLSNVLKHNPKYIKYALNLTSDDFEAESIEEANYGRYYCSTDKKWKTRKSPKKSRVSEAATKADADALTKAIKDFQTKAGLKADGIAGPQTTAAMKAASAAQAAGGAQQPAQQPAAQPAPAQQAAAPAQQTPATGQQPAAQPAAPAQQAPAQAAAPAQQAPAQQPAAAPAQPAAAPAARPAAAKGGSGPGGAYTAADINNGNMPSGLPRETVTNIQAAARSARNPNAVVYDPNDTSDF